MSIPLFIARPEKIGESLITLSETEGHHAAKVLRLSKGSPVIVVDGLGTAYRGEIDSLGRKKAQVRIHDQIRNWGEPNVRLTLASGMSTNYKFDSIVQKGTEIGVKRFVPILTSQGQVKMDDPKRARSRVKRLEKVAISAIKQCRRAYSPEISLPQSLESFLNETDDDSINLILHPSGTSGSLEDIELALGTRRVTVLVGPESGFSSEELEQAVEAGFVPISLGHRILRTETAGPAVCALIMYRLGELR